MITRMNHVSVFVLDQESAYEFYVNKLGFNVDTDAPMGPGMRWLTVTPPEQPGPEISLMPVNEGMMFNSEAARQMQALISKGTFGFGVFECDNLLLTYEELKARGVEFTKGLHVNFMVSGHCLKMILVTGFHWAKKKGS